MLVFSKQKMIERLEKEGRSHMITDDDMAIMDNLDGCDVEANCWQRVVYDKPVFWCKGKDGTGHYVNEFDCIVAK